MIMVRMIMTVALRAGDTVSSRMEWCPPAVEKGGNSVFSPSNDSHKSEITSGIEQKGQHWWNLKRKGRKKRHKVGYTGIYLS